VTNPTTSTRLATLLAGYPGMSARDVIAALPALDPAELSAVRAIETASAGRVTVLKRIDGLLDRLAVPEAPAASSSWADAPLTEWDDASAPSAPVSTSLAVPPPPPAPPATPGSTGQRPAWMKVAAIALPLVATVGLVTSRGGGAPSTQDLRGVFVLSDYSGSTGEWDDCQGDGGYSDFGPGMDVTIRNGEGDIIATTATMSADDYIDEHGDPDEDGESGADADLADTLELSDDLGWCPVLWVADVPADEAFYEVEVGSRGEVTYSAEEVDEADWSVSAGLGD
jgi:hypothetical protein